MELIIWHAGKFENSLPLPEEPDRFYAVVTDTESDPDAVIVAMTIRGKASFELLIPRAKWDDVLFLELLERHHGTEHEPWTI